MNRALLLCLLLAAPAMADDAPEATVVDPRLAEIAQSVGAAVVRCWNIGGFDPASPPVAVTVEVTMSHSGKPGTLRLLSSADGSGAQITKSFDAARRAILRCGAQGFDLNPDEYELWHTLAITFDPNAMRIE